MKVKAMSRKGQLSLPFNWIYVLIAGAVILLFFVGIVVKQMISSEQQLGTEINRILESIFGAIASAESTKVVLQTGGLSEETITFECHDKTTYYGIKGKGSPATDTTMPLFAPAEISSGEMLLWSLPYSLPFKVIDFLYLTVPNIQYVLIGNNLQVQEFLKEAKSSKAQSGGEAKFVIAAARVDDLNSLNSFPLAEGKVKVRIVDYSNSGLQNLPIPPALQGRSDAQVSAVVFDGSTATFLVKKGTAWKSEGSSPLFSLGGELDAVRYAAIFSDHKEMFDCGMQKALQRAEHVSQVYQEKGNLLLASAASQKGACPVAMSGLGELLFSHYALTQACVGLYPDNCLQLVQKSAELREKNNAIFQAECVPVY